MSRIFTRGLLAKAFPNNPRLRGQMEELDNALSDVDDKRQAVSDKLDQFMADIGDGGKYQQATKLLDAISNLPNRVGSIEIAENGEARIRPIDGQDPASLLSRGVAYTVLVGSGGMGPTSSRPVLPQGYVTLYFDTTIDPDGQPIFLRADGVWVNANGVVV